MRRIYIIFLLALVGCEDVGPKDLGEKANWTCDLTITGTDAETSLNETLAESSYEMYCSDSIENDEAMQENCNLSINDYESAGYENVNCDWSCNQSTPCEEEEEDTAL